MVISSPLINFTSADQHAELRLSGRHIEVLNLELVLAGRLRELEIRRAARACATLDGLAAGSRLPWRDLHRLIATQGHRFGFGAIGEMPGASFCVRDSRGVQKPTADRIAPHNRVSALIFETGQCGGVTFVVDVALQALP